ncbi:MAG: hypothetical protein H6529_05150 [Nocardioides sp.]|nr:hypothetical protein [Nocardioidaceae bacterium]MCB8955850.1 hypothetical protein [Nocardioides sp.]
MVRRVVTLYVSVLVMLLMMTWVYLSMRAVMDIGGSCGSGGPYVVANPCPDHIAAFMTLGIPVMLVSAFVGSGVAMGLGAPNLLLPMWWLLFGSLGWNFLDYGLFQGDVVWGWAFCGVLFELMALPALLISLPWGWTGPARIAEARAQRQAVVAERAEGPAGAAASPGAPGAGRWVVAYVLLGALGVALGWWSFHAWT